MSGGGLALGPCPYDGVAAPWLAAGRGRVGVAAQGLWDREGEEEGSVCPRPWVGSGGTSDRRISCTVDKTDYMVGSYGPRAEEYEFLTPTEEAPKGMLARGSYNIKSRFTDDDKTDHLSWEWNLTIKKEWKD